MQAPKFWYPHKKSYINFRAWILSPIGLLIYQISKYRFCNKPAYQGETPIICIGNATVGGTGKTPTAILIAQLAHSMGYQPAFLTKGYGGTITEPYLVQSNDKPHKTGDEALILNVHAPCFIAKNRVAGANHIDALKKFDLIITDDGLQNHPSLYKQCAILTVDKNRLFGNAFLMPSGPLREPVQKALHKAHCVLMIGYKETVEIPKVLTETTKSIIQAYKKPIAHGADLKGENVVVFSGLGNNDQFLQTVQQSGAHIIHSEGFPDHYQYTDRIIERLIDQARQSAALLVTTEKDMVKINPKFYPYLIPFMIQLDICDDDKQILCDHITRLCSNSM